MFKTFQQHQISMLAVFRGEAAKRNPENKQTKQIKIGNRVVVKINRGFLSQLWLFSTQIKDIKPLSL